MPRGDKSAHTDKQQRKADHIAKSYKAHGVSDTEAEMRAWATGNKDDGGSKQSGAGRGNEAEHAAAAKGGDIGGKTAASRPVAERPAAAKKGAASRKRHGEHHHAHH